MRFISIRDLHDSTPDVLRRVAKGEDMIVTRFGKPEAALIPLDQDDLEDFLLWRNPRFLRTLQESAREYGKKGGKSLTVVEQKIRRRLGKA